MPNHVTSICTVTGPESDVTAFAVTHIHDTITAKSDRFTEFDFDTIIPMPKVVRDTVRPMPWDENIGALPKSPGDYDVQIAARAILERRSIHAIAWGVDIYEAHRERLGAPQSWAELLGWFKANEPGAIFWAKRELRAAGKTGYRNWYDWAIGRWGTKWGSYAYESRAREQGAFVFKFETAWSFPRPIFRKLAKRYPTLVLDVVAYDEGDNFACTGQFNGRGDFATVKCTPELYERVYGHPHDRDEEDEPAESPTDPASAH